MLYLSPCIVLRVEEANLFEHAMQPIMWVTNVLLFLIQKNFNVRDHERANP